MQASKNSQPQTREPLTLVRLRVEGLMAPQIQQSTRSAWLVYLTAASITWQSDQVISTIARSVPLSNDPPMAISSDKLQILSIKCCKMHSDSHWVQRIQLSNRNTIFLHLAKLAQSRLRIWIKPQRQQDSNRSKVWALVSTIWRVVAPWLNYQQPETRKILLPANQLTVTQRIWAQRQCFSEDTIRSTTQRISLSAQCHTLQIILDSRRLDQKIPQMVASALKAQLTQTAILEWARTIDSNRSSLTNNNTTQLLHNKQLPKMPL